MVWWPKHVANKVNNKILLCVTENLFICSVDLARLSLRVLQYVHGTNSDNGGYKCRNLTDSAAFSHLWSCQRWIIAAHDAADEPDLKRGIVLVKCQRTCLLFVPLTFIWSVLAFKCPRPIWKLVLLKIIQTLLFLATEQRKLEMFYINCDLIGWIFRKWDVWAGIGLICLGIGTRGGHLWMRYWTFGVSWNGGNFLTSWKPIRFSRRTVLHGVSK